MLVLPEVGAMLVIYCHWYPTLCIIMTNESFVNKCNCSDVAVCSFILGRIK